MLPASTNLASLLAAPLPHLDFVLPGLLRATVGGLVSPGGVGKSFFSLSVALSMATGRDLCGLGLEPGRVLYLAGEDHEAIVAHRLDATLGALRDDPQVCSMLDRLDHRNCVGADLDLMNADVFEAMVAAARGCRLVVLDTLSRFHNLDENETADMKRLMARLECLAIRSDAAVLYLHHTSKQAALGKQATAQQAARGSSVLVDNARWASFLSPMTEQEARDNEIADMGAYVRWNASKLNYAAAQADRWYRRGPCGELQPVTFTTLAGATPQPAPESQPQLQPQPGPTVEVNLVPPAPSASSKSARARRSAPEAPAALPAVAEPQMPPSARGVNGGIW